MYVKDKLQENLSANEDNTNSQLCARFFEKPQ